MQSILLAVACMYFVLGSTFEYVKNSEYIVTGLCLITGLLKTYVSTYLLTILDWNLLYCFVILRSSPLQRPWDYRTTWWYSWSIGNVQILSHDCFHHQPCKMVLKNPTLSSLCNKCINSNLYRVFGSPMRHLRCSLTQWLSTMNTSTSFLESLWSLCQH